jgi:branched-chain amino acid transport system permease protein
MAVGAYASALVTIPVAVRATQLPDLPLIGSVELGLWGSLLAAALAAGMLAALLGAVFARFNGTAAVIATFGLLQICNVLLYGLTDVTGGAQGLYGIPRDATVVVGALLAGGAILAARLLRESRLGLKLRAGKQDELAAAAAGIDVRRTRWAAWTISGAIVGVAGALQAHSLAIVSPSSYFLVPTFTLLAMLIVGGAGTVSGAIAGAVVVTAATELLRGAEDGFALGPLHVGEVFGATQIAVGLLTLAILVLRPGGLIPERELDERRADVLPD